MKKRCRVCGNKLFKEPLLTLKNMPRSAQNFPEKKESREIRGITLKVFQCSGCGLVQLASKPVPYYREVIRAVGISEEMMNFRKKYFKEFIDKYELRNKKVIEIGCGTGDYLSLLNDLGVDAYGLEYSEKSVEICKKRGLKVFHGFIEREDYVIENSPFDAFFCLNFLEHVPFPNIFLRGIWNNLKNEAVGIIEVPNFNFQIKNKLFSEFIPDHLLYFTCDTLALTLKLNGFEVIDIKEILDKHIIAAEVKKIKRMDLSSFSENLLRLKNDIESFINQFNKIAVWGASHQALAILSQIKLKKKIAYVIDSAPFKQYKYTPSSGLPIYPPEMLKKQPVDAIIIMANIYSGEIVNIIKKEKLLNFKIAVFKEQGLEIIEI